MSRGRTESRVESGTDAVSAPADHPGPVGLRSTCPKCAAVLGTSADLRRMRHVLLRCRCGAFTRVDLAQVA